MSNLTMVEGFYGLGSFYVWCFDLEDGGFTLQSMGTAPATHMNLT